MTFSSLILFGIALGLIFLWLGILNKKNNNTHIFLIFCGGTIFVGSLILGALIVFILIPAM